MSRSVKITGSTHAFAVVIYACQACLGIEYIVGLAEAKAMTEMVGFPIVMVWALVLVLGGAFATIAALLAPNQLLTRQALVIEEVALIVVATASLWYEVTLALGNGFTVMTTQTQAVAVFAGSLARAVQVHRERRRIAVAEAAEKSTAAAAVDER